MPLYKVRNVLEAGGIKAFWKIEAGVTRGAVPEEGQGPDQEQSKQRIQKLQQELHATRQDVTAKNRQLAKLKKRQANQSKAGESPAKSPAGDPEHAEDGEVDTEAAGATLPIPPRDMGPITQARDVKGYLRMGGAIKNQLVRFAGVTPTSSILDIGAGPGRVARHFVDFIEPPGRYVGVDIEKPNMDWCEENISAANPAFNFFHQDVHNGMYNPSGQYKASEYRFPFEDDTFDLIFLTSVFTHLVPEDVQNYLSEISRLLKPDGVCFSTWFLLGHDAGVKYMNAHSKEGRVGFGFRYLLEMIEDSGLTLAQEPALGRWRGQKPPFQNKHAGGQDILLLRPQAGAESLQPRYRATNLPGASPSELEEITGTIQMFDPASNSLTVRDGDEDKVIGVPEEAELKINGQRTDSALLRPGQEVTVRVTRGEHATASSVHVTDHPFKSGKRMRKMAGTLEALDQERGLITLIVGNRVRTFEFDFQNTEVLSGDEQLSVEDLRLGQGVAVEKVGGREFIYFIG
jgi:SAM-dependent methyltransferase